MSDEERDKLGSRLAEQVGMTSTPPPDTTSPLAKRIRAENAEAELERLKALLAEHVAENLALHRECEQLRQSIRCAPSTGQIDLHAMWIASQAERRYAEQSLGNIRRALIDLQYEPFTVMASAIADIIDTWQLQRDLRADGVKA